MKPKLKPLSEQVIVITGASSGIGLATAEGAVRAGARVVLVSRNEEALAEIEQRLDSRGDRVIHVVADVANREDLERVAADTLYRFGGFDTWINNAGVSVWGRLDQVDEQDHRRVMETNFWGTFYGSIIAMAHLRGKGGAIINIGSVESETPLPFHASYSASKHAIKALTDTLRIELKKSAAPVSVTLVRPTSTDTQFIDHSKNELSSAPTLPPPVYAPEVVAEAILDAAENPQRDVYVGNARTLTNLSRHAPRFLDWLQSNVIYDWIRSGRPDRNPRGTFYRQAGERWNEELRTRGRYPGPTVPFSPTTRMSQHPLATSAIVAAAAIATYALLRRKR
ncbi:SDR family oxidoreductase [Pseudomonas sp. Marseille-QA0892]